MASWRGVGSCGSVLPVVCLFTALVRPGGALAAGFEEVPATFGGPTVFLVGMSGDGHVLVGRTLLPGPLAGIRWTQASGWQHLGAPAGNAYARPAAASFDGSVVAGTGNVNGAHRWVLGSGWHALFGGEAAAVSADGSVVAGDDVLDLFLDSVILVWQEGMGVTSHVVASYPLGFFATAITADGSQVFGNRVSPLGHSVPVRFTVGGGAEDLPAVPAGTSDECVSSVDTPCAAYALAVSAAGGTLVGGLQLTPSDPSHAVRWRGDAAPEYLGGGPPGPGSVANDVSGNGAMIVGERDGAAFLWTAGGGMQDLKARLEGLGIDLTGWTLASARAISDDGSVIAGTGTRPGGAHAIWIAQAPELVPAAQVPALRGWGAAVLALAIAALARRTTAWGQRAGGRLTPSR
jgi:uncharacterized membrane protein